MKLQFEKIFDELSSVLYKYIYYRVKDKFVAQDILQEVFIRLYKNQDNIITNEKIKSWLYKVATNSIIDYYRKKNINEIMSDSIENMEDIQDNSFHTEFSNCINHFITTLSFVYKDVLILHEYQELSVKEISQKLNMPIPTVKSKIQRGRQKLREALFLCCEFEYDHHGIPIEFKPKCCKSPKCLKF
ncbi:MAG: sigma-70 family RNA polymerase sigma factor [Arcobacteraceae bacterium]|jgi:RNA polymerase sigma-70 factor (ECF subfamily)|nr:sigma-70 family RNA polymerase sigma factor [Arcobacteraceae bacterium]